MTKMDVFISSPVETDSVVQQANKEEDANKLTVKKRKHSWSRIRMRDRVNKKCTEAVNKVKQEGYLCFQQEGDWFQGVITPPQHSVYTVHGVRIGHANATDKLVTKYEDKDKQAVDRQSSSSSTSDDGTEQDMIDAIIASMSSSASCSDDEEELQQQDKSNADLYTVTVADFETGLTYTMNEVKVALSEDFCKLTSDNLRFTSYKTYKGALADKVLLKVLGPSFVEKNLSVFKGVIQFTYEDRKCHPVDDVENSKWAL